MNALACIQHGLVILFSAVGSQTLYSHAGGRLVRFSKLEQRPKCVHYAFLHEKPFGNRFIQ